MTGFSWTAQRRKGAEMLAEGYTFKETWQALRISERTLRRWRTDSVFSDEVDRLTLAAGIATSAERLRLVKRVVRQRVDAETGRVETKKDVLEWIKLALEETSNSGATLNLHIEGFDTRLKAVYGNRGNGQQ